MQPGWVVAFALAASMLGLSACTTIPIGRSSLADDIAEDHAALNDAYGRSVNGEILINVLRSRDRWPRHYTDVAGMTDQPSIVESGTLTLSPLPFNNAANPFRTSPLAVTRSLTTRPSYGVSPMTTEAIGGAILSPTPRNVFAHYWNSGWQRDLLLLVMVSSIRERAAPVGAADMRMLEQHAGAELAVAENSQQSWSAPARNSSENLAIYCSRDAMDEHCDFYRRARELGAHDRRDAVRLLAPPSPACENGPLLAIDSDNTALMTSMAQAAAQSEANIALSGNSIMLQACEEPKSEAIILEDRSGGAVRSYLLELRSLDQMVYAMGELIRFDNGNVRLVSAPLCRAAPPEAGRICPLFRVVAERVSNDQDYAAIVHHAEGRYLAGPRVADGYDNDGDRTATTLTLLTQLFSINHSPGALATIPRLVAD